MYINSIQRSQVVKFSGPELISDGLKASGNVCSGQTSPHFSLFFGKNRHCVLHVKDRCHPDFYQVHKPTSVIVDPEH